MRTRDEIWSTEPDDDEDTRCVQCHGDPLLGDSICQACSDELVEQYDRAHADCELRDEVCRDCNVYPPPEVLYR